MQSSIIGLLALRATTWILKSVFDISTYELYLRAHQSLSVLLCVGIIFHLLSLESGLRPLVIFGGIIGGLNLASFAQFLYRNKRLAHPWPKASIRICDGAILVKLYVPRLLTFAPGQYINIWIPQVQFLSSHPFTIVQSGRDYSEQWLELLIQPRQGMTLRLWNKIESERGEITKSVLFTGPHGKTIPHMAHHTILLVASGYGIIPILSYLGDILDKYPISSLRRLHLIWVKGISGIFRRTKPWSCD